jgi:hypothetical protein
VLSCALQALEVCAEKKKRILLIQQEIKANPVSHKRTGADMVVNRCPHQMPPTP